jgi:GTP-binding protein
MLVDRVTIIVEAGKGGDGCVSFRREKFVPRGGPDGGDGGKGGDVLLKVNSHMRTLLDFRYKASFVAKKGVGGKGKKMTGANGGDFLIEVPPGTTVTDASTGEVLADLADCEETFVAARGGRGGRGNARFASSRNRSPRRHDDGGEGEQRRLRLELKLIADVGIIGLPNAGKSTLLSVLSDARPRIADYPFTTLEPHLGLVRVGEAGFVMADIPGLIEGAHSGKGLGLEFLRHVERTSVLLFLVDSSNPDPEGDYRTLAGELEAYGRELLEKPRLICLSKVDLPGTENALRIDGEEPMRISAVTRSGLDHLKHELAGVLERRS